MLKRLKMRLNLHFEDMNTCKTLINKIYLYLNITISCIKYFNQYVILAIVNVNSLKINKFSINKL